MVSALSRLRRTAHKAAALPSPILFLVIYVAVVLGHGTLLRLPFFWDEGGYYIPAALDFFHHGTLIPEFTNAHPPLPNVVLGSFWHLVGFGIVTTRLLVCAVAAGALLAVLRLAQQFLGACASLTVCLLTGVYSIWYTQSTLAHADIFAALFTLWGFVYFFRLGAVPDQPSPSSEQNSAADPTRALLALTLCFTLAALAKETSIVQPATLAILEAMYLFQGGSRTPGRAVHARRFAALSFPVLPLAAWFAYHRLRTGFMFGNPEFLRYNATANFTFAHFLNALRFRFVHLVWQRFLWIALLLALICLITRKVGGRRFHFALPGGFALPQNVLTAIAVLGAANCVAFSILGGALLTRYLLPVYPLFLLVCVPVWQARTQGWPVLAALTGTAFVCSWWINPPTYFAPEDNLTYRNMIVVHQEAIRFARTHFPESTILTAWPMASELTRPELGYIDIPLHVTTIENFTLPEIRKAAQEPGNYDTAVVFTTRYISPALRHYIETHPASRRGREYNTVRDLSPPEIARLLGGTIVWQDDHEGEWAAVLRFPRSYEAQLTAPAR